MEKNNRRNSRKRSFAVRFGLVVAMVYSLTPSETFAQRGVTATTPPSLAQLQAGNARLTAEVARLTAEVARLTAKIGRLTSNVTTSRAVGATQRQEAIASLRAVQSVLAGGATAADFKKYQLESKVKVDTLPDSQNNAPIKEVSAIYTDASTLMTAGVTQSMSASEVGYFKNKYGNDPLIGANLMEAFADIPDGGFEKGSMTTFKIELAALGARESGQYLLILAEKKLDSVK